MVDIGRVSAVLDNAVAGGGEIGGRGGPLFQCCGES